MHFHDLSCLSHHRFAPSISSLPRTNNVIIEAIVLLLVASLLLVVRPGAPSSVLDPSSDALVPNSFLLVVLHSKWHILRGASHHLRHGATPATRAPALRPARCACRALQ